MSRWNAAALAPDRWHFVRDMPNAEDRLNYMYSVDLATRCWNWLLLRDPKGYGRVTFRRKTWLAHRLSWHVFRGNVPDDLELDHLCRNPGCINPDHLEVVTSAENTRRGFSPWAVNARKTECKNGHPFTPEHTYIHLGKRHCRTCSADYTRAQREQRRTQA